MSPIAHEARRDWHHADVMAALRKTPQKWSFRRLSLASGYNDQNAVGKTARGQWWPAVERIIADALSLEPWDIWPSRYNRDGTPKRRTAHPLTSGRRGRVYKHRLA